MTGTARCLLIAGGLHHPAEAAVPSIVAALGTQGLQTDTEEDVAHACSLLGNGTYELLAVCALRWTMQGDRYDAHRARWGLSLSQPARDALVGFLERGGALLALHAAAICFDDWPQWGDILGARWIWGESGHPPYGAAQVRFVPAADGTFAAGLQDFACQDEVYRRMALASDVQPLAFARSMQDGDGGSGNWTPVLWTRQWHAARVVYSALGHDAASLGHPVHQRLLGRAACWALGRAPRDTADPAFNQPSGGIAHA